MDLFPAIDLREGRVVRLMQGDYERETTYGDDPVAVASDFVAQGATWLHVVDLDGARTGELTQLPQIQAICRGTSLRVEVGGGIRSRETIEAMLEAGVQRVILGTAALRDWDWFTSLAQDPALAHRLVLGLDAREGRLAVSGWEQTTDTLATDIARRVHGWPLAAIVYTDIATDGTLKGPNVPATAEIIQATDVPIIASGGVGTLEHLRELARLKLAGVIVGRAIYEKAFTVDEALDILRPSA